MIDVVQSDMAVISLWSAICSINGPYLLPSPLTVGECPNSHLRLFHHANGLGTNSTDRQDYLNL